MARRNVMQRRHYENIAESINVTLLNTPEGDRSVVIAAFERFATSLAHSNHNMNMSSFLDAAGIQNSITDPDTGSRGQSRGGVEGLASHKRL
jgi:formylmethanofuran dehydrogenase subunit D